MILSLIAAMSENRVIWKDNTLPWDYPEDLKRFRAITHWSAVVMWRRTYESIGKPLPWRRNVIISRSTEFPEVENYTNPDDAIAVLDNELWDEDQVFIIWWASLYEYFMEKADFVYMTEIPWMVTWWDTFFPAFEEHYDEIEREEWPDWLQFVTWRKKWVE